MILGTDQHFQQQQVLQIPCHAAARWTEVTTRRTRFNKLFVLHYRLARKMCVCMVHVQGVLLVLK